MFILRYSWDDIYSQNRQIPVRSPGPDPNAPDNDNIMENMLNHNICTLILCLFIVTFIFGSDVYFEY